MKELKTIEHPLDIFAAAHIVAHRIYRSKNIRPEQKDAYYDRLRDALDALIKGVSYAHHNDDTWFFESKPHKGRVEGEKAGHTLTLRYNKWGCNCTAGSMGTLCWARLARQIIVEIESPTFERTQPVDDSLFGDDDENE